MTHSGSVVDIPDCGPKRFQIGVRFDGCSALNHWSYHPGEANFGRADGSVQLLSYEVDTAIIRALGSMD